MSLPASEEEAFALIVADVEVELRWRELRSMFLTLGAMILALAISFLPGYAGWAATFAFTTSYCAGSTVVLAVGARVGRMRTRV